MHFEIVSPTKAYVLDATPLDLESLSKSLSYINTANQHLVKRHYNNHWAKNKNPQYWQIKLDELKATVHNCLLFEEDGKHYVRPGSLSYLEIPDSSITNLIEYPKIKKIPWAKKPPYTMYDYQEQSVSKLIEAKHAAVSITTGGGKTLIYMNILREMGLDSVVVVPSASIFNEILEKMEEHFGKGMVGAYGDGKKRLGKKFTIAITDSLVNLKEGTEAYDFFKNKKVFIGDECHLLPSETLEKVCHGVLADVPYRFMLTATHTRGDGAVRLLQSITGPIVHTLGTEEAVAGGYVCPHDFKIVKMESSNPNQQVADVLEMKRIHLLRNRNVAAFIAKLANAKALITGEQTLVLVEELSQIAMLLPLLKVPYAYAHSESSKLKLAELEANCGVLLEKVDSSESVEKFNKNEVKVLIGTSCIGTGTNIFSMTNTVNWVGGSSEIKTKQGAVGRSVRLHSANPWKDKCFLKTKCTIWDFDIEDIYVLHAHLEDRIEYYKESGSEISFLKLK